VIGHVDGQADALKEAIGAHELRGAHLKRV
jgi:hypothetical protein